jgi:ABC-type transporter Mla subunit MlaD
MVILSTVVAGYRKPFTAFHPAQLDTVHGPGRHAGNRYSNVPHSPSFGGRPYAFPKSSSGNIVEQTKAQAETAITILKSIENNKQAAQYIDSVFETSDCLDNLKDAIATIEEATKLVVENGREITYLESLVDNLENEKDITKLIKSSAQILRTLESLSPKLSAKSYKLCISSPADSIEAFGSLAHALEDIMNNFNIYMPQQSRQQLGFSSKIMSEVAKFLFSLNTSLESFETLCKNDNKSNIAVYNSIGDIMENLAALFKVMGFEKKSKDIKKQREFVKQIVVSLNY